jgi:outer membrane lipase/esterase
MLQARFLGCPPADSLPSLRSACWRFVQCVALLIGLGFGSGAMAQTAPSVNANATVVVQGFGTENDSVNLFARGIIAGSPVLRIVSATASPNSTVQVVDFDGVCVTFAPNDTTAEGALTVVVENDVGVSEAVEIPITQGFINDDAQPCADLRQRPTAIIVGGNRAVNDTDQEPGENVTVTGSATDVDGTVDISSFRWEVNGVPVPDANGQQSPTLFLPDGTNTVRLTVTDNDGATGTVTATIIVAEPGGTANSPPNVSIQGGDRVVEDTDGQPGEDVVLVGIASDADGTVDVSTYEWFINDVFVPEAEGLATFTTRLPDGENVVTLRVMDNDEQFAEATVTIIVGAVPQAETPGLEENLLTNVALTPNQRAVARAVDRLCPALGERQQEGGLTPAQEDLLVRCSLIISNSGSPAQQQEAVRRLSGEQVTGQSSTAIDFSRVNVSGLTSRLAALRQGARGISLAGLSITENGKQIPLETLAQAARALLGGGASSDEAGESLLGNKLGIFITGRYGRGDHARTANESGFDFDAKGVMIGVDYRFTNSFVLGAAASYGESDTDFYDDAGGLESESVSASLYGSWYAERLYVDFLASYGKLDFDSVRRISYMDAAGSVSATALGSTDGHLTTAAISMGYNLGRGGWTFTPNIALTGTRIKSDGFSETGAFGLDLQYGKQEADSWDVQAGVMLGYVFNHKWGVLTPQIRASYVHQEQDRGEVFVRFVNDPFSSAPGRDLDTGFIIRTDEPDSEFLRWGVSLSAVFKGGVSGFVDYQAFEGMRAISYGEFSVGLRYERPLK